MGDATLGLMHDALKEPHRLSSGMSRMGRRHSESPELARASRTTWFEDVVLNATISESKAMAKQKELPVLTSERRESLLRPSAQSELTKSRDPSKESPPRQTNSLLHAHASSPLLNERGFARGGQVVEDFLKECRQDAVRNIQLEVTGGLAGMGRAYTIDHIPDAELEACAPSTGDAHKIGELPSTAICGNDITASCFYVVGELTRNAGIYAPICTVLSSITLFCFRSVYGEVVTALPLNGGIYNLLLNSSTKRTASVTACLTILSYTATGVVSAVTAADYMQCSPMFGNLQKVPMSLAILGFFACLMLMGMKESSAVASLLFMFHLSVLSLLALFSMLFLQDMGFAQLRANMFWDGQPPFVNSIFFGFSSAMLGVSGFETSANFVEEQRPGVFPKTLTNMWVSVSIINFALPCLVIAIMPLDTVVGDSSSYALAILGERVAGPFMRDLVALDALLVLAGSVLTSYVGVCGLFQRMSGDRCLPELFSICNTWRGTPHYTIIFFFGVTSSMCVVLKGDITMLSAIYSISFLLVMGLFAFCGLWMKVKRPTLPRQIHTHPGMFALGLALVAIAFTAVVLLHPEMLTYFYIYYGITVFMVMTTFARESLFTAVLKILVNSRGVRCVLRPFIRMEVAQQWIILQVQKLRSQGIVYLTKSANLSQINLALQYIEVNEEARWVRVVHVYSSEDKIPDKLLEYVQLLDCVYPKIRIDCILVKGEFSPAVVQWISKRVQVPVNCMFINCPKHDFKHPLDTMGGLRVIQNSEKGSLLDDIKELRSVQEVDSPTFAARNGQDFCVA